MALFKVRTAEGERLARGSVEAGPTELLGPDVTLDQLLAAGTLDAPGGEPLPAGSITLAPVQGQEVWAAGGTYATSRSMYESCFAALQRIGAVT